MAGFLAGALSRDEVVRRPRTAHDDFNSGQMTCGHLVAVLILLDLFVINEMSDVDEHPAGIDLTATNVLVEGIEDLVYLDGKCASLSMAFTLAHGLFPQLAQVFTAHCSRQLDFAKGFAHGAVFNQQLEMHFSLALELGHALQESLAVQPDGPPQALVAIEDGTETERKDGSTLEAFAHNVSMLQQGLLSNFSGRDVFADDYGKLAAGIGKRLRLAYALEVLYGDGSAGSNTTL